MCSEEEVRLCSRKPKYPLTQEVCSFFSLSVWLSASDVRRYQIDDAKVYRHEGEVRFSSWESRATDL